MKVNYKPDDRMERDIAGINCDAHIVYVCAQSSCDALPTETEALVLGIYKYFHIYTVCVTELQSFCDEHDTEHKI
jgi:hypothetical protein